MAASPGSADSIEPAGDAQRIHANLVGGFKALPVLIGPMH